MDLLATVINLTAGLIILSLIVASLIATQQESMANTHSK
jgi:hypothetical protein